jgi:hypothetical protein
MSLCHILTQGSPWQNETTRSCCSIVLPTQRDSKENLQKAVLDGFTILVQILLKSTRPKSMCSTSRSCITTRHNSASSFGRISKAAPASVFLPGTKPPAGVLCSLLLRVFLMRVLTITGVDLYALAVRPSSSLSFGQACLEGTWKVQCSSRNMLFAGR